MRIVPQIGSSGGAAIPEPVVVETDGKGSIALGDWSRMGILHNYSGGVRYRTTFTLTEDEAKAKATLDLGRVIATTEVHLNGKKAGVRVAPPWRFDLADLLKPGDNRLDVLVYSTLANHYQTIPSRYRGNPEAGLFGPVSLRSRDWDTGEAAFDGDLKGFDRRIASPRNLTRQPGLVKSVTGSATHSGGGNGFAALFNGTAGNGRGGGGTENDGRTFVGLGDGNTLELEFDPAKAPKGVSVHAIVTYAGHADARASQRYSVYAARAASPTEFIKFGDVHRDSASGLNEATLGSIDKNKKALMGNVRRLRFVFANGPTGFNVYREIGVIGNVPD
ncbi:hypothetical protein HQ560_09655 [bacterium]|nr:hypothetical protein [bacterium]